MIVLEKPRVLCLGDGVGLVNPAGMLPARFASQLTYTKRYLESLGFLVRDHVVYTDWEKPQHRVKSLIDAFEDPAVKAIFPVCGGELIYEILPLIPYVQIARQPKIICGSSSLSALILAITERSGFVTFFGPHLNFLNPWASKRENQFTVRSFWNMLLWDWHGRNGLTTHERKHFFTAPKTPGSVIKAKNIYTNPQRIRSRLADNFYLSLTDIPAVSGRLLIVSLEALLRLCRAGLQPSLKGSILVLDSLDKTLAEVRQILNELTRLVAVDRINALVFSSICTRSDTTLDLPELRDQAVIQSFLMDVELLFGGSIPVFFGFPLGHCAYKLTLPIGITVELGVTSGQLTLLDSPFDDVKPA